MGFFNLVKKVENAIFLDYYISHLETKVEVMEMQLRNMRSHLEHYREIKRQKEMRKR